MKLKDRMQGIVDVILNNSHRLSAKEITSGYMKEYTSSDILATGSILNVMAELRIIQKIEIPLGKKFKVFYKNISCTRGFNATSNNCIIGVDHILGTDL